MTETTIFNQLASSAKSLKLPKPYDGRKELARNSRGKKWKSRDSKALKGMVWHQELGWGSVEEVAKYHTGSSSHLHRGGVESIAYTWAIRRDGQIVLCNNFGKSTWSQGYKGRKGDENAEFMSVMFEGLFKGSGVNDPSAGSPTAMQMLSGLALWSVCRNKWTWKESSLYGHYHFGKPSCPGISLKAIIEAARANDYDMAYDLKTVIGRQEALKKLGFYAGPIDGSWGPMSKGALIRFQSAKSLAADGIWGSRTEEAIIGALEA